MAKFTSKTGRAAGKIGKRPPDITTQIQKATKNGALLVEMSIKMLRSTKTTDNNKIKILELLYNRGYGKAISHAIVEGTLDIPTALSPEVQEVISNLNDKD